MFNKWTIASILAILLGSFAFATRVRPVNLKEMVKYADRIFWGECLGAQEVSLESGLNAVEYTFRVRRGLKGVQEGQSVSFRQIQVGDKRLGGIPGLPSYHKGQDVLIFLHGDSKIGLTSPVGMQQGLFRVLEEGGRLTVVNALRNANLDYELEETALRSAGIAKRERRLLASRQPIPLEDFSSLVRKFDGMLKDNPNQ